MRPGKALTGPSAAAPATRARAYVRDHASALGLTGADVDALGAPARTTAPGGLQTVHWTQSYRGVPVLRGDVKVNLDASGRVLGVIGGARHALRPDTVVPALSAAGALRAAGGTGAPGDSASLVLDGERLAWSVIAGDQSVLVDATTGAELHRKSLTREAGTPVHVWEQFPGTAQAQDLNTLGYLSNQATTLTNAAVHVFSDVNDNGLVEGGEEITRDAQLGFDFPFTPFTAGPACTAATQCSWNPAIGDSWRQNRAQDGVQAFYLANKFLAHLRTLVPGFQGGDRLDLRTDDGATALSTHHDNASMTTKPPGQASIMRMYLWGLDDGQRAVNGGDDAAILFHEYTHELDNRLVTTLDDDQGGAMDEGMADFQAKSYLGDEGLQPDDPNVPGEVDMGAYTDSTPHTIRTEALDCPVGRVNAACPAGGYTYGDFGHVIGGPEVHADGEIWAQTLWDLRQAVTGPVAEQLVVGGLQAVGADPDFLDLRDAILTATRAAHPELVGTVWDVFARRGMGYYAYSAGAADDTPQEDFHGPPAAGDAGTIAGTVVDGETGVPLGGATVSINGNPGFAATTDAAGAYSLPAASGRYDRIVFSGPKGYENVVVAGVTVARGAATAVNATLRRNWAASAAGATVLDQPTGGGCDADLMLDGDLSTGWSAQWTDGQTIRRPAVTVRLAGASDLTRLAALPAPVCNDSASAAAKGYRIDVSADGATFQTVLQGEFANPGTMTDLPLDAAALAKARGTRYIRLTLLTPQDPTSGDGAIWIDLAELRAFGPAGTPVAVTPTPPPVVTATPAPTVTPPPPPLARPVFSLRSSGKRSAVFTVTCASPCTVSGKLTVDARTAKQLRLGRTRVVGTLSRSLTAGKRTLTVSLTLKARRALQRSKLKSFKAKLAVSARYAGTPAVSPHRTVKIVR